MGGSTRSPSVYEEADRDEGRDENAGNEVVFKFTKGSRHEARKYAVFKIETLADEADKGGRKDGQEDQTGGRGAETVVNWVDEWEGLRSRQLHGWLCRGAMALTSKKE